ncbi:MAG: ATP-binding protein, partial [Candidatus Limnocylindria bacterium]
SPLVGRERELEQLARHCSALARGEGAALGIIAEAGIGKSRLLAEARARAAPSVTWLEGSSASLTKAVPYWPFIQIVRASAGIADEDTEAATWAKLESHCRDLFAEQADDVLPYLATAIALRLPPDVEARVRYLTGDAVGRQVFRAARLFVSGLARRRPLVLVFEDLHWVDASSASLLEHIAPLVLEVPLLLIGTSRPERDTPAAALGRAASAALGARYIEVRLAPLSADASKALARNLLGAGDPADPLPERLVTRTEGNPFFLEEVVRSLIDLGVLARDEEGRWLLVGDLERVSLPSSLRTVVTARLDRLDDQLERTLKVASVVGRTFLYRVLREVADVASSVDRDLEQLIDLELVVERTRAPELEYWFKHAVTQEAAYESILVRRRRELHRRVGEAIERLFAERIDEFHGVLAYHYARAEEWPRAQDHLFKAGDQAGRIAADAEALTHYQDAIDAYTRAFGELWAPLQRASLERRIAEALFRRGEHDRAREHLRRALAAIGEPIPTGKLAVRRAILREVLVQLGHRLLPWVFAPRAPGEGEAGSAERLRIYEIFGWIEYYVDPYRIVLSTLRLLDRSEREGFALGIVVGSFGVGFSCDLLGLSRIAGSYHRRTERVAAGLENPVARGYGDLGLAYHHHLNWDRAAAARHWESAAHHFWQAGDIRRWGAVSWGRGWVAQSTGDPAACRDYAGEMARVGRDAGDPQVRGWADFLLGWSLGEGGTLDEAERHLRGSIELLRGVPDFPNMCRSRSELGLVLLRQGRYDEALAEVEESQRLVDERKLRGFTTPVRSAAAQVYLALAERAEREDRGAWLARAGAALARARRQSRIDKQSRARVQRLAGTYEMLRGRPDAAVKAWARGRDVAAAMGLRYEHALGLADAGRLLADRAMLASAAGELEGLGATHDLRRVREELGRIPAAAA